MYKLLSKAGGVFGIAVHYGCLSHCFFEYCSDFVTVIKNYILCF